MLNAPSFCEDMLPRHFPRTKGQLEQKSAAAPTPTLPGLSLLLDDDNRVYKAEPTPKLEPRKSFEQWKQQNKAIFTDNAATMQQRKHEKKQVRFEADNQSNFSEKPSHQRSQPPVSPNLELSYYEDNVCQNQGQRAYHHQPSYRNHHDAIETGHCDGYGRNVLVPRCNSKPMTSPFTNDKAYNAAGQPPVDSPHFNRVVRSESAKENYLSATSPQAPNDKRQCHCCHSNQNQNGWEMMNYQTYNHGMPPTRCVSERQVQQQDVGHRTKGSFSTHVERNFKDQLTDDTLLSIMEEQQQHILVQQSQILMQQKQNMVQQNQIFMLQHQVQQLLLRNGNNESESPPSKLRPNTICGKTTPDSTPPNAIKLRNGSTDPVGNNGSTTAKSSIGVMTSFLGSVNDGVMPNGIQQFNERFSTKLANEKFIENMGGEYSYKDSMLDKINECIQNSSAMIDYRNNGTANRCVSPNRQSDMNIAAQALFYETSSTKNGCTNEQKTTDRSFALYMLGMKYDCAPNDAPKNMDKRDWDTKQAHNMTNTGKASDQVSVNLSPEVYDYLKRHGLLHQE